MPANDALPEISAALPDRPIRVRPPAVVGVSSSIGVFAMLFGLVAAVLWWLGPDLLADWRIGRDVVEAREAALGDASCRKRIIVFTVCDVTFREAVVGTDTADRTLWYLFIGTAGTEPVTLMRDRAAVHPRPMVVTTNVGLAKFHLRLLTLALIVGVLGLCIVVSAQMLLAGARMRRMLLDLSGQKLSALVVGMEGNIPVATRRRRWTYTYKDGSGATQRVFLELRSRLDPLFVSPDRKRALALQGPHGGVPLLLDAQLSSLDLSEQEKEAFFAACRAALERGQLS
jgi:hypothetical protein